MKYLNDIKDVGNLDKFTIMVDDEDYQHLQEWTWNYTEGRIARGTTKSGKKIAIPIANEIMHNYEAMYDHRDRNSCNNQKSNLRECLQSQNCANKGKKKGNYSSKYKGVTWNPDTKSWKGYLNFQGRYHYLGLFKTEQEAALAYNEKAKEIHREFAVLNIL